MQITTAAAVIAVLTKSRHSTMEQRVGGTQNYELKMKKNSNYITYLA